MVLYNVNKAPFYDIKWLSLKRVMKKRSPLATASGTASGIATGRLHASGVRRRRPRNVRTLLLT